MKNIMGIPFVGQFACQMYVGRLEDCYPELATTLVPRVYIIVLYLIELCGSGLCKQVLQTRTST